MLIGRDRKTNKSTHTYLLPTFRPSNIKIVPNAHRVRLFNEPKRMKESNEWTHSLQSFTENEQNKIEINVFLCYEFESLISVAVPCTFSNMLGNVQCACLLPNNKQTHSIQFRKMFVQNRLLFHLTCSINSRTNWNWICVRVTKDFFLFPRPSKLDSWF